jgi:hypothetical protein
MDYTEEDVEHLRRALLALAPNPEVAELRLQTHLMVGGAADAFDERAEQAREASARAHQIWAEEMLKFMRGDDPRTP